MKYSIHTSTCKLYKRQRIKFQSPSIMRTGKGVPTIPCTFNYLGKYLLDFGKYHQNVFPQHPKIFSQGLFSIAYPFNYFTNIPISLNTLPASLSYYKANPRDFYRYINSQKKDVQGIPPLKKRNGSGLAESDFEKAGEFNGQFTDVFTKTEHSQVPLLNRKAPFMEDIVVSKV